ncbi:MAG TPA: hypothetical protein VFO16_09850 [Pseudonocardiaceae bacterium]|nr:hypothetical protein [Pseudonocardiaceae bacterium]
MTELLHTVASWPSLLLVVLVFGFAPGFCLRLIVLAYPRNDPRRTELIAELYAAVPRLQRPLWVAEQLETALFEGLPHRLTAVLRWATRPHRKPAKVLGMLDWIRSASTFDRRTRPTNQLERRAQNIRNLLWIAGYHELRNGARHGFVVEYAPGPVTYIDDQNPEREQRVLARIQQLLRRCGYLVVRDEDSLQVTRSNWTR